MLTASPQDKGDERVTFGNVGNLGIWGQTERFPAPRAPVKPRFALNGQEIKALASARAFDLANSQKLTAAKAKGPRFRSGLRLAES